MRLWFNRQGTVQCIYSESIDLSALGSMALRRASYVEPNNEAQWTADLRLTGGPVLRTFSERRSEALMAEEQWLESLFLSGYDVKPHS